MMMSKCCQFYKIIQPSCVGKVRTKQRTLEMCKHRESNGKGLIAATTTLQCQEGLWQWLRGSHRENVFHMKLSITHYIRINYWLKKRRREEGERLKIHLLLLLVLHGMSCKDMLLIWRKWPESSIPGTILSCKFLWCVGFGNIWKYLENIKEHMQCKRKWEKGHERDKKTAHLGLREK